MKRYTIKKKEKRKKGSLKNLKTNKQTIFALKDLRQI
jgi:hypothetical protein